MPLAVGEVLSSSEKCRGRRRLAGSDIRVPGPDGNWQITEMRPSDRRTRNANMQDDSDSEQGRVRGFGAGKDPERRSDSEIKISGSKPQLRLTRDSDGSIRVELTRNSESHRESYLGLPVPLP